MTSTTAPPATRRPLVEVVAERQNVVVTDPTTAAQVGRRLLDELLDALDALDVDVPAPVGQALALVADLERALAAPPGIAAWLAGRDVAELDAATIAGAIRDVQAAAALAGDRARRDEAVAVLVDLAVDALADHADAVVDALRPTFDPAARVVADAAAAGIDPEMPADVAIGDDTLVRHWRRLPAAVATLDKVHAVYYRLLFLAGFALGVGERATAGRTGWLWACTGGPAVLVAPSRRPEPKVDERDERAVRIDRRRSGTAEDWHREATAAQDAARAAAEAQRLTHLRADALARRAAADEQGDAYPTVKIGA